VFFTPLVPGDVGKLEGGVKKLSVCGKKTECGVKGANIFKILIFTGIITMKQILVCMWLKVIQKFSA